MLKAAYRTLFLNKIWLSGGVGVIVSIFLYAFVCSLGVDQETVELFLVTCLVMGGAIVLLLCMQMARGLAGIQTLRKQLGQMPDLLRDRLEYDFHAGDQVGDLYFTSSHLFVLQFRGAPRQGIALIPYEEIQDVRMGSHAPDRTILEIRRTPGLPSHYVCFPAGIGPGLVSGINGKIAALAAHTEPLLPKPQELRKEEKRQAKAIQRRKTTDTGIWFLLADFAVIMAFCGTIGWAEQNWKVVLAARNLEAAGSSVILSARQAGALLFWPSLLFYLSMYGGSLLLLAGILHFMKGRVHRKPDETIAWKNRWQIAVFTVMVVLFVLFMGLMYSSDVGTWGRMMEGMELMRGR